MPVELSDRASRAETRISLILWTGAVSVFAGSTCTNSACIQGRGVWRGRTCAPSRCANH